MVLGVPSNDFDKQEPASDAEIRKFRVIIFSINFPMTGKQEVNGANVHPFYKWAANEFGIASRIQ
ncbi:MAG: hypothetical protein CMM47_02540 [Rhodospirillaceae bacterium]|nr:hypothetical protein [Rhodospirillaceae bacterium]